jgi:uncharacterized protein YyaL (SSP411 family)
VTEIADDPYLLQHANNPGTLEAWVSPIKLAATIKQKLNNVSVGYSAYHWLPRYGTRKFENDQYEIMNKATSI